MVSGGSGIAGYAMVQVAMLDTVWIYSIRFSMHLPQPAGRPTCALRMRRAKKPLTQFGRAALASSAHRGHHNIRSGRALCGEPAPLQIHRL